MTGVLGHLLMRRALQRQLIEIHISAFVSRRRSTVLHRRVPADERQLHDGCEITIEAIRPTWQNLRRSDAMLYTAFQPKKWPEYLQALSDTLEISIRELESLGQSDKTYRYLLEPIIREKLPAAVRQVMWRVPTKADDGSYTTYGELLSRGIMSCWKANYSRHSSVSHRK